MFLDNSEEYLRVRHHNFTQDSLFTFSFRKVHRMKKQLLFCLFLSLDILLVIVEGSQDEDHTTTFEQFYELGMDAYRLEKWSKCSTFLQRAIKDFHFYKNATVDCRLRCKSNISASLSSSKSQFFHEMIEDSNCLRRCKKKTFGMRQEGPQPSVLDQKFEKRVPYNFLQFCLFKVRFPFV